jgi:hypothetical protein
MAVKLKPGVGALNEKQFDALCASFPETEQGLSWGYPSWKAFGKFWTRLRAEDDSVVVLGVDVDEREMLCAAEPQTFHFTDHYRNSPAILVRLEEIDRPRLKVLLERKWRANAPRRWLKDWGAANSKPRD